MTFLMIHKYLKFLNFIFTVIENYWDIRDALVEILIFLSSCLSILQVPDQESRKHERQIAISPFTPPVPVPRLGKERRQKKTLVLLSLLQPQSQGLPPSAAASFFSCYYLMWIPQPFPSSSSSPH